MFFRSHWYLSEFSLVIFRVLNIFPDFPEYFSGFWVFFPCFFLPKLSDDFFLVLLAFFRIFRFFCFPEKNGILYPRIPFFPTMPLVGTNPKKNIWRLPWGLQWISHWDVAICEWDCALHNLCKLPRADQRGCKSWEPGQTFLFSQKNCHRRNVTRHHFFD